MTGYNHYPNCVCGWCSGGYRGGGGGWYGYNEKKYSSYSVSESISETNVAALNATQNSRTHQTLCWWCGEPVFYHTNGYGDHVLFDSLGYPWEIHQCWIDYWQDKQKRREVVQRIGIKEYRIKPYITSQKISNSEARYLVLKGILESLALIRVLYEDILNFCGLTEQEFSDFYRGCYELYMDNKKIMIRLSKKQPLN